MVMPLLGIMALAKIFDSEDSLKVKDTTKWIFISAGITGGLALLYALIGPSMMAFERPQDMQNYQNIIDILREVRISMFRSDAFRSAGFIVSWQLLLYGSTLMVASKNRVAYVVLALLMISGPCSSYESLPQ